jgi:hypothetical protein
MHFHAASKGERNLKASRSLSERRSILDTSKERRTSPYVEEFTESAFSLRLSVEKNLHKEIPLHSTKAQNERHLWENSVSFCVRIGFAI